MAEMYARWSQGPSEIFPCRAPCGRVASNLSVKLGKVEWLGSRQGKQGACERLAFDARTHTHAPGASVALGAVHEPCRSPEHGRNCAPIRARARRRPCSLKRPPPPSPHCRHCDPEKIPDAERASPPAPFFAIPPSQEDLHRNIARRRTLVAIGTHDLDTLSPPFRYTARPPKEIRFVPLAQESEFDADELFAYYSEPARNSPLKKFLPIIASSPVYPVRAHRHPRVARVLSALNPLAPRGPTPQALALAAAVLDLGAFRSAFATFASSRDLPSNTAAFTSATNALACGAACFARSSTCTAPRTPRACAHCLSAHADFVVCSLSFSLTHSLTHSLIHSLTLSLSRSHTHAHSLTHSLARSLALS
eukprot:1688434-Pleurochrysis_carterae.AAC.2